MGSQAGVGSNSIGSQTQDPKSGSLVRQGSLYSLTLDEVQNHLGDLGKPLCSMNLDELLKTVFNVEAHKGTGGLDFGVHQHGQLPSPLDRQSSLTLSRDLSQRTVDEVWHDIQQGQKRTNNDRKAQERQVTLGEITLEDFLVKAGVVAEPAPKNCGSNVVVDSVVLPQQSVLPQAQGMTYQIASIHQSPPQLQHQQHPQQLSIVPAFMPGHPVQQPISMSSDTIMDTSFPETQITMSPSTLMGALSDTQTPGRKRVGSGDVMEKTVERRQKRMIKNRESAARSRARKQAYTHELENKVTRLEEENERLKRQRARSKWLHKLLCFLINTTNGIRLGFYGNSLSIETQGQRSQECYGYVVILVYSSKICLLPLNSLGESMKKSVTEQFAMVVEGVFDQNIG